MLRSFFSSLPSLVFCVAVAFSQSLTQALCGAPAGAAAAAGAPALGAAGAAAGGAAGALSFFAGGGCWAPAGPSRTVTARASAAAAPPAMRAQPKATDRVLNWLISLLTSPSHRRPQPVGFSPHRNDSLAPKPRLGGSKGPIAAIP